MTDPSKPPALGLVGCGEIARQQHGRVLLGPDPPFRLAATADPHGTLPGFAGPHYPDHAAMLAGEPGLEAVSVAAPTGAHFPVARDALRAGRHVLLEKPPATTLAELDALAEEARRAGRVLVTSFHARHNPAVERLRAILAEQAAPPERVEINWREDFERWHAGQTWPWRPGGFGVFDPGINALSILTHILPGLDLRVEGALLRVPPGAATPAYAELRLGYEGGSGRAVFEWRRGGTDVWDIAVRPASAPGGAPPETLTLRGVRTLLRGAEALVATAEDREYAGVYAGFLAAIRRGEGEVSRTELRLIEEATRTATVEALAEAP